MRGALFAVLLLLSACTLGGPLTPASPAASEAGTKARKLLAEGARIVDVRTPGEFAERHVEGAVNIPVHVLSRHIAELGSSDKPVIVYCRSGTRSAIAARILRDASFSQVFDLGAMDNW